MRKFMVWLLAVSCLVTLVACNESKENEETTIKVTDEAVTKPESKLFFDESKYTAEKGEMDYSNVDSAYAMQTTEYKLKNDYTGELPDVIMVEATNITFGKDKIATLATDGWELVNGNKLDSIVKAHLATDTIIKDGNDKHAMIYAANSTDNEMSYSDCVINQLKIDYSESAVYYDSEQAADFNYKGITSSSSAEDVISIMSEPNKIYITNYYENDECYKSLITLSYSSIDEDLNRIDFTVEYTDDKSNIKMTEMLLLHN